MADAPSGEDLAGRGDSMEQRRRGEAELREQQAFAEMLELAAKPAVDSTEFYATWALPLLAFVVAAAIGWLSMVGAWREFPPMLIAPLVTAAVVSVLVSMATREYAHDRQQYKRQLAEQGMQRLLLR